VPVLSSQQALLISISRKRLRFVLSEFSISHRLALPSMNYCFPKSGEASKPSSPYRVYAAAQAVCSKRVQLVVAILVGILSILVCYYLYLDRLYIVDEVLQGTRLREYTLKEKLTIRVVAPRKLEDLNKFVLEHSICQAVQEIQIIWPHQQARPPDSYFKYPHTHSKVTFIETHGSGAWDTLYGSSKYTTEGDSSLDLIIFHF
jgi:hypothetical protein